MKSKAHSKKCMDLGVSVGLIDDQDGEEEFGKKLKSSFFTELLCLFCHLSFLPFLFQSFLILLQEKDTGIKILRASPREPETLEKLSLKEMTSIC